MEYPAGNAGIAGCEELDKGLVSIDIFKVFSTRYVVNERRTKNWNARYHVDLLKIEEGTQSHYLLIKYVSKL